MTMHDATGPAFFQLGTLTSSIQQIERMRTAWTLRGSDQSLGTALGTTQVGHGGKRPDNDGVIEKNCHVDGA